MCPQGCANGGRCSAPETCACAPGFTGADCRQDVDECADDATNTCAGLAHGVCVNAAGWHHCDCLPGYRLFLNGSEAVCADVDECEEGSHGCAGDGVGCVNSQGGYTCECLLYGCQKGRNG